MHATFSLEREALPSYNYLERLVDPGTGFTFFDVFRTEPAEAAHDWPDFLDVPGRSAETCVLLRHMTGRPLATEDDYLGRLYALQEDDGLFHRPETAITRACAPREEQALVLAALVARAAADRDAGAERRAARLVDAIAIAPDAPGSFSSMLIRPLVGAWSLLGLEEALRTVRPIAERAAGPEGLFRPDGSFAGHVHSHLYAAAGLVELARLTGDADLLERMERVFRVMRGRSTSFGFVPELTERGDDVVGCETCCLMDYLHLAFALARAGRTELYDDAERAVRNHLVESRVRSGDWLAEREGSHDEPLLRRSGLREAVVGAYAGWSAPNHILAYDEYLPATWIKEPDLAPIYLGKVRALQNCCSPSGPKALYLAWQHAARVEAGTLRVNLLMDRALPEAEVRCFEPWQGRVEVRLEAALRVAVRAPGGVRPAEVQAAVNRRPLPVRDEGGYVTTAVLQPGDTAVFRYPLHEREEDVTIGNTGFQQYAYRVRWRGSTVLAMEAGDNAQWGRSHLMERPVRLYYGAEGPHPLYRRDHLLLAPPVCGPLHRSAGPEVW